MKKIKVIAGFLYCCIGLHCSCHDNTKKNETTASYKPGLGEFMMQLQYHQEQMGLAIKDSNYARVDYETAEMDEVAELIKQYHNKHEKLIVPFTKQYAMYVEAPLAAIKKQSVERNMQQLKNNYTMMISSCNSCHAANKMEFLKIKE